MAEIPKLSVLLDIDDVQAKTAQTLITYSNAVWGTALRIVDFQDNFMQMWGVGRAEATRRWFEFCDASLSRLEPMDESVRVVAELPENIALRSLTSRRITQKAVTVGWERHHFSRISWVHFAAINWDGDSEAHLRTKKSDIRRIKESNGTEVDVFVDNELKHVLGSHTIVGSAVLFDAQGIHLDRELPQNVVRITNWPNLGEYIEEQAEQKLRQAA